MSKSTSAIAAVHAASATTPAPVTDAPVSTFGDDGTQAAYYASMSVKDAGTYATAVLPLLSPVQVAEVAGIVGKWAMQDAADKAIGRLGRLVRKGKSADKAYRLLAGVATFAHDTANLTFAGHGRMGYTLLAEVPATPERPVSGRIKVTFVPDMLPNEKGMPVVNAGHAAPVKDDSASE